jgi:exosortase A-associated hydrolase 1
MGDSVADGRIGHFEGVESDIAAAVAALHRSVPGLQRTVLWGLCDGASAALLYLQGRRDPRIGGLVAVNPWVRTPAGQARTTVRHYYLRRLLDRSFWRKLISGNVGWSALEGFVRNAGAAVAPDVVGTQGYTQRMAQGWGGLAFTGMLALSEHDFTAREFEVHTGSDPSWRRAFSQRPPLRVYLPGADHTCSQPGAMQALNEATSTYLLRLGEAS